VFWDKAGTKSNTARLKCVLPGLHAPESSVLLTWSCKSSLRGSLFCYRLPNTLGSTVPCWQSFPLQLRCND